MLFLVKFVIQYIGDQRAGIYFIQLMTFQIIDEMYLFQGLCAAGYYLDSTTGICTACTAGTYKESAGSDQCLDCPTTGTTTSATAATAESDCSKNAFSLLI